MKVENHSITITNHKNSEVGEMIAETDRFSGNPVVVDAALL